MSSLISLSQAAGLASRYRSNRETILATAYKNQNTLPICETFTKSDIDALLTQSGCTGLRIYYGMDTSYRTHAIIVGVNSSDEDILTANYEQIAEDSRRCPTDCPPASALNS